MAIWSAEIKELEKLFGSLKGQLPDLEKELERLIKADDENMILLYSRRCLEVIITDLCECELKRPRKTEPLKGIIDKLHKEGKVPSHIITSMHGLNELSTYGTHPKDFDPEQVKPVLVNLDIIIKWYLKYKETGTEIKIKRVEEFKQEIKSTEDVKKSITTPKKKLIGLFSGFILIILIVVAVLFFTKIIGSGKQTEQIEKSIAVLPFKLLSDEPDKQFMADGMMEAITLHLSKITDLRVMSTPSVEQYRSTKKTNRTIGQELNVAYLLKGSFQKFGDNVKLIVQLIKANEDSYKWGNEYNSKWGEILTLQSEVAQKIANELNVVISPEEKQLIEKVATADSNAYNFYLKGREEEGKFPLYDLVISSTIAAGVNPSAKESIERAEIMYNAALKYDSTFAPAYTGLAGIYWSKNYSKEYLSENFMDSVLILVGKALSFDDQLPDAYFIRGLYYSEKGNVKKALENLDKTLKLNPNYWQAYYVIGDMNDDALLAIENYQKAASRHHGPGLSEIYNKISFRLSLTGFSELAKDFSLKAVKLESDSTKYYFWLWMYEFDHKKCFEFYEKKYSLDPTNLDALRFLSDYYEITGQAKESLEFHKKVLNRAKAERRPTLINSTQRMGYAYWENGLKDSADYYFNKQIEYCNDAIRLHRSSYSTAYYDLAGVYAFKGDKIKAYDNLRIYNQRPNINLWVRRYIKYDPLFNSIRNELEFQNIMNDMDAKYQAQHERVRKWLIEQGML
jgi:TolB-like protein